MTPHRHGVFAKGGRGSCPPHTPLLVEAVEEGTLAYSEAVMEDVVFVMEMSEHKAF
jgi:hypothetical protein